MSAHPSHPASDPTRFTCPCGWRVARTAATRAAAARAVERARAHHVATAHPDGDPAAPAGDAGPRARDSFVEDDEGPSPYRVPARDYLLVLLVIVILAAVVYALYTVAVDPARLSI